MAKSDLFNEGWYLARYPDVESQGVDAAVHYLDHGGLEGRSPSPEFNGEWYLERNADVRQAGLNPLIHFLENGKAEGRRIRPVDDRSKQRIDRHDLERGPSVGGQYPADIVVSSAVGNWRAGGRSFTALEHELEGLSSTDERGVLFGSDQIIIDGHCFKVMPNDNQKLRRCLKWLAALASRTFANEPEELACVIQDRTGEGALSMADCWFSDDFTLRLRIAFPSGSPLKPAIVRCFQQNEAGKLLTCADAALGEVGTSIVDARLRSRFRPLLLILGDPDGNLLDCGLIAFPSLARGGLHYCERVSVSAGRSLTGVQDYSLDLLRTGPQNGNVPAVGRIEIDLSRATGNEPLFDEDLLNWLAKDLGLELVTVGSTAYSVWLAERIAALPGRSPNALMQQRGGTIMLPAAAIPSLHLLFAATGECDDSFTRYLIADSIAREPIVEWELPLRANLPFRQKVPRLDLDVPGSASLGGPLAIIFENEPEHLAKALFPISLDAPLPIKSAPSDAEQSTLSVIVSGPTDGASIAALTKSLSNQAGNLDLEMILACPVEDAERALHEALASFPIVQPQLQSDDTWKRACEAAELAKGAKLLFVSGQLLLHDPRTLATLLEISKYDGVGTLGCALVVEKSEGKQVRYSSHTGYLASLDNPVGSSEMFWEQPGLEHSLLPPNLLLAANSPHCLLIDRDTWQQCRDGIDAVNEPWLALGTELARRGLDNICVTWLTASLRPVGSELAPKAQCAGEATRISSFRSFGQ